MHRRPARRRDASGRRRIARLALVAFLATATAAAAVCGDGVLDAGEPCDQTAPGGDAACPGACIPAGIAGECTCARPATDVRRYVAVGATQLRLGSNVLVGGGNLAAAAAGGLVQIGRESITVERTQVIGARARVLSGAFIGRLFANAAFVNPGATLAAGGPFAVALPLVVPREIDPPAGTAGSATVDVAAGETRGLSPGDYDAVTVAPGATLVLSGLSAGGAGVYHLRMLVLTTGARLLANNPVLVHVDERLAFSGIGSGNGSVVGPAAAARLVAGDLQFVADGSARLGHGAIVAAHIEAPSIRMGPNAVFTGRIRGGKVAIARGTALFVEGGCGDGFLDAGEECDTSALGGDAACPGACVPGDPAGLGRITLGQPGQCTCRCATDADCDDGNACNGVEACRDHVCVPGIPPNCTDHNSCTRDCDPAVGCVRIPVTDGTPCNDANACTTNDTCQNGTCTPGPPAPDGTECSDHNPCTINDACRAGTCTPGPPRDCDDKNPCTTDTCDPTAGCQHMPVTDGTPCGTAQTCHAAVCG